jgi:NTP pyrophosphatase (non-canonical NTP hydrolase)
MTTLQEIEMFRDITERMSAIFADKRQDYGPTTTETVEKFGPVAMLVRMYDKMGRLDNLLVKGNVNHVGEKVQDTLLDLANYAIITIIELHKQDMKKTKGAQECLRESLQAKI